MPIRLNKATQPIARVEDVIICRENECGWVCSKRRNKLLKGPKIIASQDLEAMALKRENAFGQQLSIAGRNP
jgi:hypothetical protein